MRWSAAVLLILTPALHAELYRWTDENGQVHYSDRASNSEAEQIEQRAPAQIGQGDDIELMNERLDRLRASEAEVTAREQAQAAKTAEKKEKLRKQCAQQKYRAMQFQTMAAYHLDDNGNRVFYSKQEVEQKIAEIQTWIEKNCQE